MYKDYILFNCLLEYIVSPTCPSSNLFSPYCVYIRKSSKEANRRSKDTSLFEGGRRELTLALRELILTRCGRYFKKFGAKLTAIWYLI